MSRDQMQDVFPVDISYKKGEQADSNKFTGFARQTDTAFARVTQAVGDPWEYSVHTGNLSGPYNLSPEKLAQASLSRVIGPSDYISPAGVSFEQSFSDSGTITLKGGRNSWCLGFPLVYNATAAQIGPSSLIDDVMTPLDPESQIIKVNGAASTYLGAAVENLTDLSSSGDFHVDAFKGIITIFAPVDEDLIIRLDDISMISAGIPWGSANIIPTWNQTSPLCRVEFIETVDELSKYNLTLPLIQAQPRTSPATASFMVGGQKGHVSGSSSALYADAVFSSGTPGFNVEYYKLPYSVTSKLEDSGTDVLPEGFALLWDESAGRVVPNITFVYKSKTQLELQTPAEWLGTASVNDSQYRLIVTGASLAETVGYLASVVRDNRHIGLSNGATSVGTISYTPPLSHSDMTDLYTADFESYFTTYGDTRRSALSFSKSFIPTNDHPQYLHRAGFMSEESTPNTKNAMRGDIVFASTTNFSTGSSNSTGYRGTTYGVSFGNSSLVTSNSTSIRFDGGAYTSWISGAARKLWFGNTKVGALPLDTAGTRYGALTYIGYNGTPVHIRGEAAAGDDLESAGGLLGFDLGQTSELNYIKLMPGYRDTTVAGKGVANLPAYTHNTATIFRYELSNTPSLSNRLSTDQIREFRFRGVAYVPDADTSLPAEEGDGISASGEHEKYFTSPAIVGADFFNVYSNAIFFSEEGDGKYTSFTQLADTWLNQGNNGSPTGLYYNPSSRSLSFAYNVSTGSSYVPLSVGETCSLKSYGSTSSSSIYFYSNSGGLYSSTEDRTQILTREGYCLISAGNDGTPPAAVNASDGNINIVAENDIYIKAYDDLSITCDRLDLDFTSGQFYIEYTSLHGAEGDGLRCLVIDPDTGKVYRGPLLSAVKN